MSRIKRARPSPAILVGVIALVAALGGTAVAEVATTSLSKKDKKQVKNIAKKQGKKQANRQIEKKAPGLSVANAANAGDADTVNDLSVRRLFTQVATDAVTQTVLNAGGLQITLACPGGQYDLKGTSQVNNSRIAVRRGSGGTIGSKDFDSGVSQSLPGVVSGELLGLVFTQPNGATVNGQLVVDRPTIYGSAGSCAVSGVVTVG